MNQVFPLPHKRTKNWKPKRNIMSSVQPNSKDPVEDVLARITISAYEVALRQGFTGSFLDLELALWDELRDVLQKVIGVRKSSQEPLLASGG